MRVGVYVDGFNLYYGGRALCGAHTPGWRWLDVRSLVAARLPGNWGDAAITRLVYCTARVSGVDDPTSPRDQDRYLRALELSGAADVIEYGNFVARVRTSPLATEKRRGKPAIVESQWPVMVKDEDRNDVPRARFVVSHLHREEKGSDVNVATHLLLDALAHDVDGAVVVSNDSDLKLPVAEARMRVPVGVLTPRGPLAGDLAFDPSDGVGRHWHGTLTAGDLHEHQLPDPVGPVPKPPDWWSIRKAGTFTSTHPAPAGAGFLFGVSDTTGTLGASVHKARSGAPRVPVVRERQLDRPVVGGP